jgi:hypothetical protein
MGKTADETVVLIPSRTENSEWGNDKINTLPDSKGEKRVKFLFKALVQYCTALKNRAKQRKR